MAVTSYTIQGSSVIGAQRSVWGDLVLTLDGGSFDTGLAYVNSATITSNDALDAGGVRVELNTDGSGAANGSIKVTVASGEFTNANVMTIGYGGG
jgi:hypothetical protein